MPSDADSDLDSTTAKLGTNRAVSADLVAHVWSPYCNAFVMRNSTWTMRQSVRALLVSPLVPTYPGRAARLTNRPAVNQR